MAQYLIEAPHSEQKCLAALRHIAMYRTQILNHSWFGCTDGVHCGWVTVEADSKSEALNVLPPTERRGARVVEVRRFTVEELIAKHDEQ